MISGRSSPERPRWSRCTGRRRPTSCCASRSHRYGRGSIWRGRRGPSCRPVSLSSAEGPADWLSSAEGRSPGGERDRGEVGGDLERRHHARRHHASHSRRLDRGRQRLVGGIDHERRRDRSVELGDTDDRRLVAELGEHPVGRSLQGGAADDRRDGDDRFAAPGEQLVDTAQARGSARSTRAGSTGRSPRRQPSRAPCVPAPTAWHRRGRTAPPRPRRRGAAARSSPGSRSRRARRRSPSCAADRRSSAAARRRDPMPS